MVCWDCAVIVMTMFQIQGDGCLSGGERRHSGVLLFNVKEAGQWEVRGGADVGGTEYKSRKGGVSVRRSFWILIEACQPS